MAGGIFNDLFGAGDLSVVLSFIVTRWTGMNKEVLTQKEEIKQPQFDAGVSKERFEIAPFGGVFVHLRKKSEFCLQVKPKKVQSLSPLTGLKTKKYCF